ncbi:hypothetical protein CLV47_103256 [Antricoccus suffuscus]|uniref:Intracellular proteinase inhibitor BsuPI domain-containing protein n=1 Tax=Antricoccus suffuscus TaxID=1629062 RepID=A0A2T1A4F1_9ACTN|nr:hypothetical protein [Antricoccus suffuscus]PRZ43198.1 hypothetical protein CLV47_103256 [Antricoccus suffuscus]
MQVATDKPAYVAGDKPRLILSVVNKSTVPCIRDLNAAGQELLIFDAAGGRLWSSNDCYPESSNDTRTLAAGQKVDYTVIWSGKVSEPTCTAPRPLLGPGTYAVQAVQGGIQSAPGQIVLQ